ncbi:MAG: DUF1616 domain-containing protein [Promethearchaeota archaeon]
MEKITKDKEKTKKSISNKHFDLLLKISLILGIIIVSGFIVYYAFHPEPGYVTLGILNENRRAEDYPTKASINETVFFYISVGNHLNKDFSFQIRIKKGDNNTILSRSIESNGTLVFIVGNFTLKNKENWISEQLNISFSEIGTNQLIIAELWQIIKASQINFYNNVYLRLNITS